MATTTTRNRVGITPSDLEVMEAIFVAANADSHNHAFRFNLTLDCWELWEIDMATGTMLACLTYASNGWEPL